MPTVPVCVSVRLSKSEIQDLGHLAERNTEGMSDDMKASFKRQQKTKQFINRQELGEGMQRKPNQPDAEKIKQHKKILNMTPQQKKRYIENGV